MATLTKLALYAFTLIPLFAFAYAQRICPSRSCLTCVTAKVHDAPGVGFDLGFSYGVSALHLYNGTKIDVTTANANQEYITLLQRLSNSPSPPRKTRLQKFRRWLNKKRGLPSTPDVGIISRMITSIYTATQSAYPAVKIETVAITTPHVPALPLEDLNDAIEYAGLDSWLVDFSLWPGILAEYKAAAAANGIAVCENYRDMYDCESEGRERGIETVYSVTFTRQALYTSINSFYSALGRSWQPESYHFDIGSGLSRLPDYTDSNQYWQRIRAQLLSLPHDSTRPISKIVLAGETASDPRFLEVLRDALSELNIHNMEYPGAKQNKNRYAHLEVNIENVADPLFAAARGAALYARWRQEAPLHCAEKEDMQCEAKRDAERRGTEVGSHAIEELR